MSEILVKLHKLHPGQQQIISEAKRFNVLKCGRQFGKTDLSKELVINPMLDGKKVGYWYPTYKDGDKIWQEICFILHDVIEKKDQQLKKLTLITGGTLDMWTMDDPNSGRGFTYHRVIVDEAEKARHLKDSWEQTIRATLLFYKGDAWFLSTPKFGQTYFKTVLFTNELKSDNWKSWRFTSFDNPFLDPAEIEDAKRLDELVFKCEYLAEDVDLAQRPFAYAYSDAIHKGKRVFDPNLELMLAFDFNKDPITCVASQHGEAPAEGRHKPDIDMELRYIKQFKLANSDIYALCDEIKASYDVYNPLYLITGDATGRARSALVRGNVNYWKVIKSEMGVSDNQIKTPSVNPSVKDTRVLVNSMFQNYNIIVDEDNCPDLIQDFKYVECDEFGDLLKDRTGEYKKADLLDCARYNQATFFKWFIKNNPKNPLNEEIIDDNY